MVCILLADGFEEIEALTQIDYLRRAGIDIRCAAVGNMTVTGGHGIKVIADMPLADVKKESLDMLILPGGMGGVNGLTNSEEACDLIRYASENARLAAICAAPTLVASLGLVKGKKCICYPGMEDILAENGGIVTTESVVVDGNLVTSRGPGTSEQFALTLIALLAGNETAQKIRRGIVAR